MKDQEIPVTNTKLVRGEDQYTDVEFLAYLVKNFKHKKNKNGSPFTINDINQYCLKGTLPKCYGGNILTVEKVEGKLRLITLQ